MVTILQVKKMATPNLMVISGVVGVGLSTIKNTINVYVKKITDWILLQIPKEIEGYKTEVIETGEFIALQERTDKWRPAPGGVSIGHYSITAGTLGTRAIDNVSGKRVILSNNHVLANSDSIQNSRAKKGDKIYQPGVYDGGTLTDTIANLERWVKMDEIGINTVDCAIATPINDADLSDDVLEIGTITETAEVTEGMAVQKSGRTSGLNTETILDVNATVDVNYGKFVARFDDQIITGYMASGGDSGSALCTMDNKIVGLLFAGSFARTIHCKIGNVADLLNINFKAPTPPTPGGILPILLGGGVLAAVMMVKPAKKKPKREPPKIPKEKDKKGLLIIGGLAAVGIVAYLLLKPKPEEAYINVNSTPTGADIYLNGSYIGKTPISNYEVDPGTHTLLLVKEGYEDYTETFTISEGETKTFNITLIPIIPPEVSARINLFTITAT